MCRGMYKWNAAATRVDSHETLPLCGGGQGGALVEQVRRRWRFPHLEASVSTTGFPLQRIDHRFEPSRIELRDRFIDHHRREVRCFCVDNCVFAVGVEQHFVKTVEHAVDVQQSAAFAFDGLFEKGGGALRRFS